MITVNASVLPDCAHCGGVLGSRSLTEKERCAAIVCAACGGVTLIEMTIVVTKLIRPDVVLR